MPVDLTTHAKQFVPSHLKDAADPYLGAMAAPQEQARLDADAAILEVEPGTASGRWLDLVGAGNYGISRTTGESDARYRTRIMSPASAVVAEDIEAAINVILTDEGYDDVVLTPWHDDNHFMDDDADPGGLFLDYDRLPLINGFTLTVLTSVPTQAVNEICALTEQIRAAGCPFQLLAIDPYTFEDIGVAADAIWNPFQSGNTYVASTSYTTLVDQSGNGRDAIAVGTPSATAEIYPSRDLGLAAVPDQGASFMRWSTPATTLWDFTSITWQPLTSMQNDQRFWQFRTLSQQLALRFETTGTRSMYLQMGVDNLWLDVTASIGEPPDLRAGYGPDAYVLTALRCSTDSLLEGATATWTVVSIADLDDGNGPQIIANDSHTEAISTTGARFTNRNSFAGVEASNMNLAGGHALWFEALSDSAMVLGMLAGIATVKVSNAEAVEALLDGVTIG